MRDIEREREGSVETERLRDLGDPDPVQSPNGGHWVSTASWACVAGARKHIVHHRPHW